MNHRRPATVALALSVVAGCTSRTFESPAIRPAVTVRNVQAYHQNNKLDLLFMVDDSTSMKTMQGKLKDQLPLFMKQLSGGAGLPDVHIAVVSSDMGVPTDANVCTPHGDSGVFQSQPRGECTATTLAAGATFLSDTGKLAGDQANFTAPIADVFQCVALLGDRGCGFENQLASIDRALGADGQGPPPPENAGFLRDDAVLAIVMLTNEDDCSAPANTKLYSLNGGPESIANPMGPVGGGFRCNRYGHLCTDPATGATGQMPPLMPPSDATGNPPVLTLKDCVPNDTGSGMLTPVQKFIDDIRGLKPGREDQILVAAIAAPTELYAVTWTTSPEVATESWPVVMHSCGTTSDGPSNPAAVPTSDGSFGDPAIRIKKFVEGFQDSVFASVCDDSYATALTAISSRIVTKFAPPCLTGKIAQTPEGRPDCSVVDRIFDDRSNQWMDHALTDCDQNGNQAPCWTLVAGTGTCTGQALSVNESAANRATDSIERSVECSVCAPGSTQPGCN